MTRMHVLFQHEMLLRLCCFFTVFGIMALWEILAPKRQLHASKSQRWLNNWCLVIVNTVVLRLLFPTAAVGVAAYAQQKQLGLFHIFTPPFATLCSLILLDLVIYLQHVLMHALPVLWRFHRVHHADLDFDVTTGSRFHPVEIILSMIIKFAAIILIGPSVIAVLLFEIVLNAMSMFNHSNVRLVKKLDTWLRFLVVTPDMHRVHHSVLVNEINSNFGFNLSLWDRLFGTYRKAPSLGHQKMTIGIHNYRSAKTVIQLKGVLLLPFVAKVKAYAINQQEQG